MTGLLQHSEQINRLIDSGYPFALYRLPGTDELCLVVSHAKMPVRLDTCTALNGREGFVFAPFHISGKHPLLLIQPDVMLSGREAIADYLSTIQPGQTAAPSPSENISVPDVGKNNYPVVFERFITALQAKRFDKLVLSRRVTQPRKPDFSPAETFAGACGKYNNAFVYLCYTPFSGLWTGSSPEVLLKGGRGEYQTVALAGTRKAKADPAGITRWDVKNKSEQLFVADYIREVLEHNAEQWTAEKTETLTAGNVVHLKTGFRFTFPDTQRLGDLLQQLHPTPAVCGLPKEEAFRFILEEEGYDREYYSGFMGYVSATGQTDLYVNLRCMKIEPRQLNLFAGGGLLPSSTRENEWKETEEKLKTMRGLL